MCFIIVVPRDINVLNDVYLILHSTREDLYEWLISNHITTQPVLAMGTEAPDGVPEDAIYRGLKMMENKMKRDGLIVETIDLYKSVQEKKRLFIVTPVGEASLN